MTLTCLKLAQVGIALIGLCYSPDSVTNSALVTKGLVYVPDMSEIYTEAHTILANKSDSVQDQQYTANKSVVPLADPMRDSLT
jgi:hypothetical protein